MALQPLQTTGDRDSVTRFKSVTWLDSVIRLEVVVRLDLITELESMARFESVARLGGKCRTICRFKVFLCLNALSQNRQENGLPDVCTDMCFFKSDGRSCIFAQMGQVRSNIQACDFK